MCHLNADSRSKVNFLLILSFAYIMKYSSSYPLSERPRDHRETESTTITCDAGYVLDLDTEKCIPAHVTSTTSAKPKNPVMVILVNETSRPEVALMSPSRDWLIVVFNQIILYPNCSSNGEGHDCFVRSVRCEEIFHPATVAKIGHDAQCSIEGNSITAEIHPVRETGLRAKDVIQFSSSCPLATIQFKGQLHYIRRLNTSCTVPVDLISSDYDLPTHGSEAEYTSATHDDETTPSSPQTGRGPSTVSTNTVTHFEDEKRRGEEPVATRNTTSRLDDRDQQNKNTSHVSTTTRQPEEASRPFPSTKRGTIVMLDATPTYSADDNATEATPTRWRGQSSLWLAFAIEGPIEALKLDRTYGEEELTAFIQKQLARLLTLPLSSVGMPLITGSDPVIVESRLSESKNSVSEEMLLTARSKFISELKKGADEGRKVSLKWKRAVDDDGDRQVLTLFLVPKPQERINPEIDNVASEVDHSVNGTDASADRKLMDLQSIKSWSYILIAVVVLTISMIFMILVTICLVKRHMIRKLSRQVTPTSLSKIKTSAESDRRRTGPVDSSASHFSSGLIELVDLKGANRKLNRCTLDRGWRGESAQEAKCDSQGKFSYDSGVWISGLAMSPERRSMPSLTGNVPNAASYKPPSADQLSNTPKPPLDLRAKLKNEWNMQLDGNPIVISGRRGSLARTTSLIYDKS